MFIFISVDCLFGKSCVWFVFICVMCWFEIIYLLLDENLVW